MVINMKKNLFDRVIAAIVVPMGIALSIAPASASTTISSTWDRPNDLDGWTRNYPRSLPGVGSGDWDSRIGWSSDHSLVLYDAAEGSPDWVFAPTKFLGDWSVGGKLSFDYYSNNNDTARLVDVVSANGIYFTPYINIHNGWTHFDFDLSSFGANVKDVVALGINMDIHGGPESDHLSNFVLTLNDPKGPGAAVPEPATWLSFVVGLAGLALLRRRCGGARVI
ncbi:MAG: PEP-CTERM sorting domain-containing protein [Telmatospirillum sp.]|nr:PEP-CTERM sorting domain-containing protein [Telmatospirillum sp.]